MKKMRGFFVALLISIVGFAQQQSITIRGEVISQVDLLPLPGASVFVPSKTVGTETNTKDMIKSYSIGTVTDFDGKFSLKVPKNTTEIAVSFLGHKPKTVLLTGDKKYVIYLEGEITDLNEVIVTGYQKINKRAITGAVNKIKVENIKQTALPSVDVMLQGQVAGVNITQQNGGAPGELSKIRIRGNTSLIGARDPLWVIDGLPLEQNDAPDIAQLKALDLQDTNIDLGASDNSVNLLRNYSIAGINPMDIEDITILKDAAATAIYGARAANGVIIITTKKGQKGKMKVNFFANTFATQRPDFSKLNLLNSSQKVDLELQLASIKSLKFRNDKGAVMAILTESGELAKYQEKGFTILSEATKRKINRLRLNSYDWGRELYRSQINQQYGLSISGGSERSNYYLSLGYYDEKGSTVGSGFKRYNVSLKNQYKFSDKFEVGLGLFIAQSEKESFLSDQNSLTSVINYSRDVNPYFLPYKADGSYNYDKNVEYIKDGKGLRADFNPIEERENTSYDSENLALKAIADLNYKFIPQVEFRSQLGLQIENTDVERYATQDTYYIRKYKLDFGKRKGSYFPDGGIIQNNQTKFFQYNWKNILEYNQLFSNIHKVTVLLGSEMRSNITKNILARGFGYDKKTGISQELIFTSPGGKSTDKKNRSYDRSIRENRFLSYFVTASYTYDNRYTLFGSARYDGSDLNGVDERNKFSPIYSISGVWNAGNEEFLRTNEVISNLRLRFSYGTQGNIDKSTTPFIIGEYGKVNILPNTSESKLDVKSAPNKNLRWEITKNINAGLDFGLFGDRINLTADYYKRKSVDVIGLKSLPLASGFSVQKINYGEISNKGFEVGLNTINVRNDNFSWATTFTISKNESILDKAGYNNDNNNLGLPYYVEGKPINAIYAIKTAGYDKNGLPLFNGKDDKGKPKVMGLVEYFKFKESGEGIETEYSTKEFKNLFTYMGSADPEFTGGLVNTFTYKNIDLTVSGNFVLNQYVKRDLPYNPITFDRGLNYNADILDRWKDGNKGVYPGFIDKEKLEFEAKSKEDKQKIKDDKLAYDILEKGSKGFNFYPSMDTWVKKMSYFRVSSIRLGYSLPKDVITSLKMTSLRLGVEARNMFVFGTDYTGYFDPETYGNAYAQPLPKTISLSINATF